MHQKNIMWLAAVTLLPVLFALAVQYDARKNSGTVYVEQPTPAPVSFILNTANPEKAQTTFRLASKLYGKGVHTTVFLEGAGVLLVHTPFAKEAGYEGEIIVCPECLKLYGIDKQKLPDNVSAITTDISAGMHTRTTDSSAVPQ
ncbi:hypothetical protein [Halodesulfovibrio spirochaetisodalis]|uniref:Uncharacterized protein n=1 Tax=Halodesulfovibrio spirochaetisodalis TaxID=1560234 RepID=A0A1B7XCL5_9BACT|nr:hypothetical protein [Halodesulfovibrio spirochaetisodalis]OBQ51724.1 hypothetical protein SP90_08965 [Halodesulfovibrio spirochaetisodalis]